MFYSCHHGHFHQLFHQLLKGTKQSFVLQDVTPAILLRKHQWIGRNLVETWEIWKSTLIPIFIIGVYYALGILFYGHYEGWGFIESCFFITTTITTVGYGYQYPTSDESRVFTIFFIAFGMITIYGILTTRMQEIAYKVESRFMNQTFMLSERVHEITRQFFGLFYYCISLTILTLVGASIFMSVRNPGMLALIKLYNVFTI